MNREKLLEKTLSDIVAAWEALDGGQTYQPLVVEKWLCGDMAPAISQARKVLGIDRSSDI